MLCDSNDCCCILVRMCEMCGMPLEAMFTAFGRAGITVSITNTQRDPLEENVYVCLCVQVSLFLR